VCELLKLSTTVAMFGYHAHTETLGASAWMILFVQLVVPAPSGEASPPPQAERLEARATVDSAAAIVFLFT